MTAYLQIASNSFLAKFKSDPAIMKAIYSFIENQNSPNTKIAYFADLSFFVEFLNLKDFRSVTREHFVLYKTYLTENYATSTVARKIVSCRSFFLWLEQLNLIEENPTRLIKAPKLDSQHGKTPDLADAEVKRLLAAPDQDTPNGYRDFVILEFLFYLGLRVSELVGIQLSSFSYENGYHVLQVTGKGNHQRLIPLKPFLIADKNRLIETWPNGFSSDDSFLFQPLYNRRFEEIDKSLSANTVLKLVYSYGEEAEIETPICVHTGRVVVNGKALDAGASDQEVMNLLGWKSHSMVRRYRRRKEQLRSSAAHRISY